MAIYESIQGSPKSRLEHNLREKTTYYNEDIDISKSHLNYSVLTRKGSDTVKDKLIYTQHLLANTYVRNGNITCGEWVCTAPADLPEKQEKLFFESTYNFLNHYLFDDDDSRCICAQVHCDEAGKSHLHYIFVLPEIKNPKYQSIKEKFKEGYLKANLTLDTYAIKKLYATIIDFERESNEIETIHKIKDILKISRDEARSIFLKLRRKETEKYKTKLIPKDQFLTKKVFQNFHPEYQKWINEEGFDCTVYKGGGGINLSVAQLKELTKTTGKKLEGNLSVEFLADILNENEKLREQIKSLTKDKSHAWGSSHDWNGEKERGDRKWSIDF